MVIQNVLPVAALVFLSLACNVESGDGSDSKNPSSEKSDSNSETFSGGNGDRTTGDGTSSFSNLSETSSEQGLTLAECPAEAPADLEEGVSVTGVLEGDEFAWSCTRDKLDTTHQRATAATTFNAYNIICLNNVPGERSNFWVQGPVAGQVFGTQLPYGSTIPNLTAQVKIGDAELERDSFTIDPEYVQYARAIVWSLDENAQLAGKPAHRLKGCIEASFNAQVGKSEGHFLIRFDATIETFGL